MGIERKRELLSEELGNVWTGGMNEMEIANMTERLMVKTRPS